MTESYWADNLSKKDIQEGSFFYKSTINAWKNALLSVHNNSNEENQIETDQDFSDLICNSNIFAFILVIPKYSDISTLIDSFITNIDILSEWSTINIDLFDQTDSQIIESILKNIDVKNDRLSNVEVFRYVLYPNSEKSNLTQQNKSDLLHAITDLMRSHTLQLHNEILLDCHIFSIQHLFQEHKIACFDMDSTLIEQEVIVELAKATGIGNQVNHITESAMRGEIDFNESFSKRLRLLHGTYSNILEEVNENLTLSAGAKTTLTLLGVLGYHTVLISGGFTFFAKSISNSLNINEYHANDLIIEDNKIIGEVRLPIVNKERKADIVKDICNKQGVKTSQVICIGDGANDLDMMSIADLGVAYHAKPVVRKQANISINATGLEGLLYTLGIKSLEFLI